MDLGARLQAPERAGHDVPIADHDPLGLARRAPRVHEDEQTVLVTDIRKGTGRGGGEQSLVLLRSLDGVCEADDGPQRGDVAADLLDDGPELGVDEERDDFGVLENVPELVAAEAPIEWHDHVAGPGRRVVELDEAMVVEGENGYVLTGSDAERPEGVRQPVDTFVERPPRQTVLLEHQRLPVGGQSAPLAGDVAEGDHRCSPVTTTAACP